MIKVKALAQLGAWTQLQVMIESKKMLVSKSFMAEVCQSYGKNELAGMAA
jgi:hypothetical protein